MIQLLEACYISGYQIELAFSDGRRGIFNVQTYLATRQGPLLKALHDETYFPVDQRPGFSADRILSSATTGYLRIRL